MRNTRHAQYCIATISIFCLIFISHSLLVRASTVDDLKNKIDEKHQAIADLEKEMAQLDSQIQTTQGEAKSLKNTLKVLDITQKKLETQLKITQEQIEQASLTIQTLSSEIGSKQDAIDTNLRATANTIRKLNEIGSASFIEMMLNNQSINELWDEIETLQRFQNEVTQNMSQLKTLKTDLETHKSESETRKASLITLKAQFADQKKIIDQNKKEKNTLLTLTNNKESAYKQILAQKKALSDAFQNELLEFESQLKIAVDPGSLPSTGSGVLHWPLDAIKVTQYFGQTEFALATHSYNGKGHNGVDFKASSGTRVKAALDGVVLGTGNTDLVCSGASYGKWVLIKHPNGLSTLYGHLSLIKVVEGQNVATGEVIAYSGDTGYVTGPHLHFTVMATQGSKIMQVKSQVCKGTYTMPVADLKAYLNPLSYL